MTLNDVVSNIGNLKVEYLVIGVIVVAAAIIVTKYIKKIVINALFYGIGLYTLAEGMGIDIIGLAKALIAKFLMQQ